VDPWFVLLISNRSLSKTNKIRSERIGKRKNSREEQQRHKILARVNKEDVEIRGRRRIEKKF
jgi:hypothetical protein